VTLAKIDGEVHVFAQLPPQTREAICLGEIYVCMKRSYGPGLPNGSSVEQTCFDVATSAGTKQVCAEIRIFTYDTREALAACADCRPEDGRPGGRYNYSDFECYQPRLTALDSRLPVAGAEGGDALSALAAAVAACAEAGAP
jgi:hypothetical protein